MSAHRQRNSAGSTVYDSFAYTYDSANRVYSFSDAEHADEDVKYTYDADGQLTAAAILDTGESTNEANTYSDSYDPNGNAATINGGSTVTGKGNRLLSDGTWYYAYDLNGNLASQTGISGGTAAGQSIDYTYNVKNELVAVAKYTSGVETQAIAYTYDMNGQLLSRTLTNYTDGVAGTPSMANYVYGPSGNMALAFVDGSLTDRYLSGPAIDQILADDQLTGGEHTWWVATDQEGTVKDLFEYDSGTDATTVASHLAYSPFGQLDTADSTGLGVATVDFLFGYTGTWTDPDTGLQWHNDPSSGSIGRWYNPVLQRWMSPDPSGLGPDSDPYRYVQNRPTDGVDPSGFQEILPYPGPHGEWPGYVNPNNGNPTATHPAPATPPPPQPPAGDNYPAFPNGKIVFFISNRTVRGDAEAAEASKLFTTHEGSTVMTVTSKAQIQYDLNDIARGHERLAGIVISGHGAGNCGVTFNGGLSITDANLTDADVQAFKNTLKPAGVVEIASCSNTANDTQIFADKVGYTVTACGGLCTGFDPGAGFSSPHTKNPENIISGKK